MPEDYPVKESKYVAFNNHANKKECGHITCLFCFIVGKVVV
jgi:hypothetical protein